MPNQLKIAAIDIGSNAMRAVFAEYQGGKLSFFKNYRYPIRLGSDAFEKGRLSPKKIKELENAFGELFLKISKHNITKVKAVATSALRDSKNSEEVINLIKFQTGIEINVIDGLKEAHLIKTAVSTTVDLKNKNYLLVDIGGGSTEVTLCENDRVTFSKSYQYGTVRLLKIKEVKKRSVELVSFIKEVKEDLSHRLKNKKIHACIGTGGNLRRIGKLRKLLLGKPNTRIKKYELEVIKKIMAKKSIDERVEIFGMAKDRADVILPAMEIISLVIDAYNVEDLFLPKVGLKEGLAIELIHSHPSEVHFNANFQ